jgi:AcrR family transcriptional regulator
MPSTDTYHHGDLRRELKDGALRVIAADGLAGLSLRKVASAAGVSHAAPYHHFADKSALVRALGYEGLRVLDDRMAEAESAGGDDPGERLLAIGSAYVLFSASSPAYFLAMGAPEMREPHAPEQEEEHGETWERLVRAVAACQAAGMLDPREEAAVLAIGLWSLVEGLAQLWGTGLLARLPLAAGGLEQLVDSIIRATFAGMRPAPALQAASTAACAAR